MLLKVALRPPLALLVAGLTGCGGGGSTALSGHPGASPGPAVYYQIERVGRPGVKEMFEPFQDHQISNGAEPYDDPTLKSDIAMTERALRYGPLGPHDSSHDYGKTLARFFYPDALVVNLTGVITAPPQTHGEYYLSNELSGGVDFGGRAPNDDVIDLELSLMFGNAIGTLGLALEDDAENYCLASQNINGPGVYGGQNPAKTATGVFPYFPRPL